MRRGALLACLALAGCGNYADFKLPEPAGPRAAGGYRLEARPEPVLSRGEPGGWDSRDVLNPSVVRHNSVFYNFYSGFDGRTWHTGLATSDDGIHWRKQGAVLSPGPAPWEGAYIAANGSALFHGGQFLYWYQAGDRATPVLALARSRDGRHWEKLGSPVLQPGPRGSWDERGVADPCVIRVRDSFYLFYLGQDRARRQRLGVARSTDGSTWQKLRSNPILELGGIGAFDEMGLGEPAVWIGRGYYWMLYTGRDHAENRRLGWARSRDGIHWEKLATSFAGEQPWNSKVVCDPTVEAVGRSLAVWFGGGDAASPDENLNGQIGIAFLEPLDATLAK